MTSTDVSVKTAEEIARIASLLNHPLRVRLLLALATTGPGSATGLSVQLGGLTVGDCHYHLTALKKGGVIRLARSRPVRGATERVYRLAPLIRTTRGATYLQEFIDVITPPTTSTANAPVIAAHVRAVAGEAVEQRGRHDLPGTNDPV